MLTVALFFQHVNMTLQLCTKVVFFGGYPMIKLSKSNVSHILLFTIAAGVFLSNPIDVNTPTAVEASTLTFDITPNSFQSPLPGGLSDGKETTGSVSVNGVEIRLGVKYASKDTSLNLSKNNSGVLYNIDPLPGTIDSIRIEQGSGQKNELFLGNSGRIINSLEGNVTPIGGTFFVLSPVFEVAGTGQDYSISNNTAYPTIKSPTKVSYFAIQAAGGTNSPINLLRFIMTVSSTLATSGAGSAYTFALDFMQQTENKNNLCTDADLKWSYNSINPASPETLETENPQTLEVQFLKLSEAARDAFKNATEVEIVTARDRYLYLRTFRPTLYDFVYGASRLPI